MNRSVDVVIPVFNAGNYICDTVRQVSEQQLPDGWQLNIYAVDDGSTDDTRQRLLQLQDAVPALNLVCADENGGRSQACNLGLEAGSGAVLVICDADCRYDRTDAIAGFINEIGRGADVVIGLVALAGDGFWARYTNSVASERVANEATQGLMSYTTANFALRRDAFERLQGFSPDYGHYGFEDKDLLIRVERSRLSAVVRDDIRVSHDDDFTLAAVCRKAEESGRYSGPVFRRRFPDEYRKLPYARCDAMAGGGSRVLRPLSLPIKHLARLLAATALALPGPLFRLQRFAVRVAVCAAYFRGTAVQKTPTRSA